MLKLSTPADGSHLLRQILARYLLRSTVQPRLTPPALNQEPELPTAGPRQTFPSAVMNQTDLAATATLGRRRRLPQRSIVVHRCGLGIPWQLPGSWLGLHSNPSHYLTEIWNSTAKKLPPGCKVNQSFISPCWVDIQMSMLFSPSSLLHSYISIHQTIIILVKVNNTREKTKNFWKQIYIQLIIEKKGLYKDESSG